jgi:isopentenyl-diphosphate delta-isomerase
MEKDQVILVDDQDTEVGHMDKMEAHRTGTLHRAFSVFIFNNNGQMLLQQRALGKYHSGGLWTNACCSHPRPGEDSAIAAHRRLEEEMGFTTSLEKIFDFVYKAELNNGLTEHEFDHVYTGQYDGGIYPDTQEVSSWHFKDTGEIEKELRSTPGLYTIWFRLAFPKVMEWKNKQDYSQPV